VVTAACTPVLAPSPTTPSGACTIFPADNVWNTPVTALPAHPSSAAWMTAMGSSSRNLHPDYGPADEGEQPYGIPVQAVAANQALVPVAFDYDDESDPGGYPLSASTPIESGSDAHAIMVNGSSCMLYETYATEYRAGGQSTAGSGAIWNLRSNALRPAGWTSADAAGLPVLPGLVSYDEVATGAVNHAIRITAQCTSRSYLWPARHQAGSSNASCPPMGARFRLSSSFTLPASSCAAHCQAVVTAFKRYGAIVADNGSNWYLTGTSDSRWTSTDVEQLKRIPAGAFQAVDASCLMVSADSGQAYQPGTPAYTQHCG
jgi:hypothetical protein